MYLLQHHVQPWDLSLFCWGNLGIPRISTGPSSGAGTQDPLPLPLPPQPILTLSTPSHSFPPGLVALSAQGPALANAYGPFGCGLQPYWPRPAHQTHRNKIYWPLFLVLLALASGPVGLHIHPGPPQPIVFATGRGSSGFCSLRHIA